MRPIRLIRGLIAILGIAASETALPAEIRAALHNHLFVPKVVVQFFCLSTCCFVYFARACRIRLLRNLHGPRPKKTSEAFLFMPPSQG